MKHTRIFYSIVQRLFDQKLPLFVSAVRIVYRAYDFFIATSLKQKNVFTVYTRDGLLSLEGSIDEGI